jgi:sigma-B regulation protein RsbU (phosphoserine phosphatase)
VERILIVDDSRDNRNLLRVILKKHGYDLLEAADGEQALKTVEHEDLDLILLDIIMPVKDGYQTCEILKSNKDSQDIPVIFLSAKDDVSDKIRGLELGAADYITKPFNKAEVVARVKTQLKIHGLTRSLARANDELLEKQNRLEEDLAAAAEIQQSLIPASSPEVENCCFAYRFIPSDLSGGDIFNVHRLDEEHVAIYIVDVSGHGVPAAMVTVSVAQSLQPHGRTILKEHQPGHPYYRLASPVEVLNKLDQQYPMERFDKYFTTVYMVLNTRTGELQYSNAAHPLPILLRNSGQIELLEAGGPIIGMGNMVPFEPGECTLKPGDRLYLYTDGISEFANHNDEFFDEDRMYVELIRHRNRSLDESCEKLLQALQEFAGGRKAQDDISLLALEFGIDAH